MPGPGGGSASDRFLADLARWVAAERAAGSAAGRSMARALSDRSAATATWEGLLVDLAEQAAVVSIHAGGAQVAGRLVGIGRDFVAVDQPSGRLTLIRTAAISWLARPGRGPARPGGQRSPHLDLALASVFEGLAAERMPVWLTTASGALEGELSSLGDDVLTLRLAGDRSAHLPLAAVICCELR